MSYRSAAVQHPPPVAEKRRLFRDRVDAKHFDRTDAAGTQPGSAITGEIELPAPFASTRSEEPFQRRFLTQSSDAKIGADLVGGLADAGTYRGGDGVGGGP